MMIEQGDLLKISGYKYPAVVVSNHFFNTSGKAIVCPVLQSAQEGPLHIPLETDRLKGYILCEQLRYVDLSERSHTRIGSIPYFNVMDLSDAIMGMFDYQV